MRNNVDLNHALDHLGSVRALLNPAGQVISRFDYDPWGQRSWISGTVDSSFGYAGYFRHSASGLDLTLFRAYDPELGRWLSRDPILEAGGLNVYGYVGNSVNFTDPLGLYWGENYVNYVRGAVGGTGDFITQYFRQLDATYWTGRSHNGWENQDKYFHCMANCEASQRGKGGEDAAVCISNAREATDQFMGDPPSASAADQLANKFGRSQGAANPNGSCQNLCDKYRPGGSFPF